MKLHNVTSGVLVAASLYMIPFGAQANGLYTAGKVEIGPGAGFMHAAFNVRYNPSATQTSFVRFTPDVVMNRVSVFARDDSGTFFSCSIHSSSNLYPKALQVAAALGNGTHLFVNRLSGTSDCNDFLVTIGSNHLD